MCRDRNSQKGGKKLQLVINGVKKYRVQIRVAERKKEMVKKNTSRSNSNFWDGEQHAISCDGRVKAKGIRTRYFEIFENSTCEVIIKQRANFHNLNKTGNEKVSSREKYFCHKTK